MKCMKLTILVSLFLVTGFIRGAQGAPWQWPRTDAARQHLDGERLRELVHAIREGEKYLHLHSLLIIRNGCLVVEEYFGGYTAGLRHTLQSVSKSFTSAVVGIALKRGDIKDVNERIIDFYPRLKNDPALDPRWRELRLEHLLTMRSGTDYHENGSDSPHFQLNRLARGWDEFYLKRPMLRDPGTHFLYDSGGVILMSSLLKQRSGMHADEYMKIHLFEPLSIEETSWFRNEEGHPHTGGGLFLKPLDMAKFGQLYLQEGRWQDRQVIPADWVKKSFSRHVELSRNPRGVIAYGYLWWILSPDPDGKENIPIYAAMGFRAQYIFVIPEHRMVVVVTGGTTSSAEQRKPVEFLYSHILPSVRRQPATGATR